MAHFNKTFMQRHRKHEITLLEGFRFEYDSQLVK